VENVLSVHRHRDIRDNATSNDVVRISRTLVMCAPADATEIPNLSGTASRADACAGPSKSVVAPPPAGAAGGPAVRVWLAPPIRIPSGARGRAARAPRGPPPPRGPGSTVLKPP
jgi:hypothetical protein